MNEKQTIRFFKPIDFKPYWIKQSQKNVIMFNDELIINTLCFKHDKESLDKAFGIRRRHFKFDISLIKLQELMKYYGVTTYHRGIPYTTTTDLIIDCKLEVPDICKQ